MREHYRTKYGPWKDTSVRSCLSSVVYNGKISWKGEIYPGRHEAIIDDATFSAAREKDRSRLDSNFPKHPFQRTTLLGGLIWCGHCGARYYCKQNTSKRPGITPAQKYYTCYSRGKSAKSMIRDPNCKNKSYNVKDLDRLVLEEIQALTIDPSRVDALIQIGQNTDCQERIRVIQNRIAAIDRQSEKLVDLYALGSIDLSIIASRVEALDTEKQQLEAELESLEIPQPLLSREATDRALQDFASITSGSPTQEQLRDAVHALINGIVIDMDNVEIHWNFV